MKYIIPVLQRCTYAFIIIPCMWIFLGIGCIGYILWHFKLPSKQWSKGCGVIGPYDNRNSDHDYMNFSLALGLPEIYDEWPTIYHWLIDKGKITYYDYGDGNKLTHPLQRLHPRLRRMKELQTIQIGSVVATFKQEVANVE